MSERINGEDIYAVEPNADPTIPYDQLGDMAVELYETEADMLNERITKIVAASVQHGQVELGQYASPHTRQAAHAAAVKAVRYALGIDKLDDEQQGDN